MADTPDRETELRNLTKRLERVEAQLERLTELGVVPRSITKARPVVSEPHPQASASVSTSVNVETDNLSSQTVAVAAPPSQSSQRDVRAASKSRTSAPAATLVMGFTAAVAFVLAAVYFVKLVYDAGWLTPGIQIGFAAASGIALIAAGTVFGRHDRSYAAYLPAVGVVVLYLAIFAGHLHYKLFGDTFALGAVAMTTLCAMWLARQFDNSIYILFAVVGVYITPILMEGLRVSVLELVIYYTAWSLLFSFAAIHEGRRLPYMLAMLFAIIGFDLSWRISGGDQWSLAVIYQFMQFLIFALTTFMFSVRHKSVLSGGEAAVHGVGLFYFYGVQYFTLLENVPELAPWIALASVVVVLLVYSVASRRLSDDAQLSGSAVLTSCYASVVSAHIVYFELIPAEYFAWAALLAPVAAGFASQLFATKEARAPLYFVSGVILIAGYLGAFAGRSFANQVIPSAQILLFVYALVLYAAFFWLRRDMHSSRIATLVLYAGHAALLVATLHAFNNDLLISVLWGAFALVLLLWAIKKDDAVIGKSSLLIFAASGLKVLLHDLDGSSQFTRVLVLVVLSASLYVGGWLYQKVNTSVREFTGNPLVDKQITRIAEMIEEGYTSEGVVEKFLSQNVVLYGSSEPWTVRKVDEIRSTFGI